MPTVYRVIDMRDGAVAVQHFAESDSAEGAAKRALGLDLVRRGKTLPIARVYSQPTDQPMMVVRLYSRE